MFSYILINNDGRKIYCNTFLPRNKKVLSKSIITYRIFDEKIYNIFIFIYILYKIHSSFCLCNKKKYNQLLRIRAMKYEDSSLFLDLKTDSAALYYYSFSS